jgi:ATP-dependent Clp protease ATP-binding subunit ClpC
MMAERVRAQLRNRDMGLELTDSAKRFLVKKDWNPLMGARPLRRTIQREIEDFLSERILFNDLRPGQIAVIDCEGDPDDPGNARLVFTITAGDPDASGLVGVGGPGD